MAVGNEQGGSPKMYLGLYEGRFVRKHKTPIEGVTETRSNKQGDLVHEQYFNFISGTITDIELKTPKPEYQTYGVTCLITIEDGEEKVCLQVKLLSGYFINFVQKFLSSEIGSPIYLSAYSMPREDNKGNNYGIWGKQFGEKLPNCFTQEHGLPEWEKVDTGEAIVYNKKKQVFWLIQKLVLHCLEAKANILKFPEEDAYLNITGYGELKALPVGLPFKGSSPTLDNHKGNAAMKANESFTSNTPPSSVTVPPPTANPSYDTGADDDDLPF
jgi:hypothetical protein